MMRQSLEINSKSGDQQCHIYRSLISSESFEINSYMKYMYKACIDLRKSSALPETFNNILYALLVQVLLAGGDKLEMWHKRRAREARTALIAAMVYNPLFRQVATL